MLGDQVSVGRHRVPPLSLSIHLPIDERKSFVSICHRAVPVRVRKDKQNKVASGFVYCSHLHYKFHPFYGPCLQCFENVSFP